MGVQWTTHDHPTLFHTIYRDVQTGHPDRMVCRSVAFGFPRTEWRWPAWPKKRSPRFFSKEQSHVTPSEEPLPLGAILPTATDVAWRKRVSGVG